MKKSDNKPTTSQKANNEDATREELRHNLAIARAIMRLREENQAKETTEEQKQPEYLTEAHRKNEEAAKKQIAEWQANPAPLSEILERQRKRELQAQEYENKKYEQTEADRGNSEKTIKEETERKNSKLKTKRKN